MKLKDKRVKIKDIFLDPYNPRFTDASNIKQDDIIKKISKKRDAKDLLASMQIDIKWVNKIVVVSKENFSEQQKGIIGIEECEYLVVEGNNRLACLKSGKIEGYTNETEIPVMEAVRDDNENIEDFYSQLRITQGIANVMVVKEWSVIAKAKHLHTMYMDIKSKRNGSFKSPHELYKKISNELGLKLTEVRQMIVRYEFFKVINELSDEIPEERWGYLEAFDKNVETRKKFGMDAQTNELDIENPENEEIEEILMEIPTLIDKAHRSGINTKQFRDIISSLLKDLNESNEVLELFLNITRDDSEFSFVNQLSEKSEASEEEKWNTDLKEIVKKLQSYPILSSWSSSQLSLLENVVEISNRLVGLVNEDRED